MVLRLRPVVFETRWHAEGAALREVVASIASEIRDLDRERSQRLRARKTHDAEKFERAIETIICNFVAISMCEPGRMLMVRFGNNASAASPIYGRHFNRVVNLMVDLGMVKKRVGHRVNAKVRKASEIKATPLLAERLSAVSSWSSLRLEKFDSLIALKQDDEIRDIRLAVRPDESWLRTVEVEMAQINQHLGRADFEGDPRGIVHLTDIPGSIADFLLTPHHQMVRRIFNGGYEFGGRVFGGWWETLERSKRFQYIRINGSPVVNVDYGQLFLRLAYALSKTTPPPGDLYDLTGTDHQRNDWLELREGRKKLANALIFNSQELKQWPGKTVAERAAVRDCFPIGTTPRGAARAIKARHHAIAGDWFEKGRGLELMRIESDMLVAVLLRLIAVGVTALPLHDSVIVAQRDAPLAERAMEDVARMHIGTEMPVKIENGRDCG